MKSSLKVILLAFVVICGVSCNRRSSHYERNGRYRSQGTNVTQPQPYEHASHNTVNPVVTPRNVDKAKPSVEQIKQDLVGHSLSEGVQDGYYPSHWRWTIREGEISNFCINHVSTESSTEYEIQVNMRLTSKAGKAFDAKVRIRYLFSESEGWYMQFAQSQGMFIVKTGKYNDCIHSFLDQGWATSTFWIENNCEIALEVGGEYLEYDGWKRFSVVVNPHDREGRMWVNDGRIDYVEIP